MVSIPAMFTGTLYRQQRPLPRYVREHFDGGSLFKSLRASGYRVDNISEIPYDMRSASNTYRMRRPHVSYAEYVQFAGWQLADLSVFRHAPHILRPAIYNNQAWRLQTMLGPGDTTGRRHFPVNGAAILQELAERLTPAVDQPLYKFIHVGIPHRPVSIDADCDYFEGLRPTRDNYKAQTRCAVRAWLRCSIASRGRRLRRGAHRHRIRSWNRLPSAEVREQPADACRRAGHSLRQVDGTAHRQATAEPGRCASVPCADDYQ